MTRAATNEMLELADQMATAVMLVVTPATILPQDSDEVFDAFEAATGHHRVWEILYRCATFLTDVRDGGAECPREGVGRLPGVHRRHPATTTAPSDPLLSSTPSGPRLRAGPSASG